MFNAKRILMLLVVFVVAAGSAAPAATIPFSASGTSGTIDPNNSLPWLLTPNDQNVGVTDNPLLRGISVWGSPGLAVSPPPGMAGPDTWPDGVGQAVAFTITFTDLPDGVTIDQTPDATMMGFDDFTRFHNLSDTVIWTPSYSGGDSVTFTAPSGYSMPAGTQFYVNIAFTGPSDIAPAADPTVDTIAFTGDFTTASVPEPGSLSMFALAFLGMAAFARRRILR